MAAILRVFFFLALSSSILNSNYVSADNRGNDCKKKKECNCECTHMDARAKGPGPCSIAEKKGDWCEISYSLSTGSIGKFSTGPDFKTNTQKLGGLPDHRSDQYAKMILSLRDDIIYNRDIVAIMANKAADKKENDEGRRIIALLLRSAYISSPEITSSELNNLDDILHRLFFDGYQSDRRIGDDLVSAFFNVRRTTALLISSSNLSSPFLDNALAQPGYFYINKGGFELHLIWRSFIPE